MNERDLDALGREAMARREPEVDLWPRLRPRPRAPRLLTEAFACLVSGVCALVLLWLLFPAHPAEPDRPSGPPPQFASEDEKAVASWLANGFAMTSPKTSGERH